MTRRGLRLSTRTNASGSRRRSSSATASGSCRHHSSSSARISGSDGGAKSRSPRAARKIETRSALQDDGPAGGPQTVDHRVGLSGVFGDGEVSLRRHEPDEVVARSGALGLVRLVGDDRQPRVDLHRVGDDNLRAEPLGQPDRDLRLAQRGRPEQRDQRRLRHRPHPRRRSPRRPPPSRPRGRHRLDSPSTQRVTRKRSRSQGLSVGNARLLPGDAYLGLHAVHALQIRQENAAAPAGTHDDAVAAPDPDRRTCRAGWG